MSCRKEEERNEKIVRGLLKLPPNRRCINCNSLGPQYVCTNFWTFVCITCSGIHREFTHRVKCVSMSKFTSQEVETLQNGGNQRAKETYLKDWDIQRQRFPDSSNIEMIRVFIKNVYVDKIYAGGKTSDRPRKDFQSLISHEDDTRRASSYHSYSQSPPYDYQYEDRRYGKPGAILTRKPGSDRGLYEGKILSFVCSPDRASRQAYEDKFSNGSYHSRVSDYSASSGGDPFRSGPQSPSSQSKGGISNPPIEPSRDILIDDVQHQTRKQDANGKRDADGIPLPQRSTSSGSFGSFDSKSMYLNSFNSGSLDVVSEPEQPVSAHKGNKSTFPSLGTSSHSVNFGGLDLFEAPVVPQHVNSSVSAVDFLELPAVSISPIDLCQPSFSAASSTGLPQQAHLFSPTSLDLFSGVAVSSQEVPAIKSDNISPALSVPDNEGWATFDTPPSMKSNLVVDTLSCMKAPSFDNESLGKDDPVVSSNINLQLPSFQSYNDERPFHLPSFQSYGDQGPSLSIANPWHEGLHDQVFTNEASTQSWNAFEDFAEHLQSSEPKVAMHEPSSIANEYLNLGVQEVATSTLLPLGPPSQITDFKSTNPFDLPFDANWESSNMFLDMSSLQAELLNALSPSSSLGEVTEPWFAENSVMSFVPASTEGGLAYVSGQAPHSQLQNVLTQDPVTSLEGNPFV